MVSVTTPKATDPAAPAVWVAAAVWTPAALAGAALLGAGPAAVAVAVAGAGVLAGGVLVAGAALAVALADAELVVPPPVAEDRAATADAESGVVVTVVETATVENGPPARLALSVWLPPRDTNTAASSTTNPVTRAANDIKVIRRGGRNMSGFFVRLAPLLEECKCRSTSLE